MSQPSALHAVAAIVLDLTDRKGLRQAWEMIDEEIRAEIIERWQQILSDSQPSGEEIREAAAKIAEAKADERWSTGSAFEITSSEAADEIAAAIRAMPLPLSSGSNKSDDGKKGQAG